MKNIQRTNRFFKTLIASCIALSCIALCSCEEDDIDNFLGNTASDSTNSKGLKEALRVGTDTAVSQLAVDGGYFRDLTVKIFLPKQLENSINQFKAKQINVLGLGNLTGEQIYTTGIPGFTEALQDKEDNLILGINQAAETAANDAQPIFVDAITSMSILDANAILFGEDTAATHFLRINTFLELYDAYEPKVDLALNSVQIGNKSVATRYESFVEDYNNVLNTSIPTGLSQKTIGELMNIKTVTVTDLSEHGTTKGLDGLFLKISEEEKSIREDPLARVTELLRRVFSKLD